MREIRTSSDHSLAPNLAPWFLNPAARMHMLEIISSGNGVPKKKRPVTSGDISPHYGQYEATNEKFTAGDAKVIL